MEYRTAPGRALNRVVQSGAATKQLTEQLIQENEMDDLKQAGNRIRSFVERIENIDEELQALNDAKKEIFSEAKGEGYDVKILKEILKLRKQRPDERDEHEVLLDTYMRALDAATAESK